MSETNSIEVKAETENGALQTNSEAIVPGIPSIDTSSIVKNENSVSFDIYTKDDGFRYDVVLILKEKELKKRILVNGNGRNNTNFNFSKKNGPLSHIGVAVYNKNLTIYLNTSFVLTPQTYYESISTMEGG